MSFLPSMPADLLPAKEKDDLDAARKALEAWARARKYHIIDINGWTRWTYGECPFWSVWVEASGGDTFFFGELGLHIYDDGRVVCITKTWGRKGGGD